MTSRRLVPLIFAVGVAFASCSVGPEESVPSSATDSAPAPTAPGTTDAIITTTADDSAGAESSEDAPTSTTEQEPEVTGTEPADRELPIAYDGYASGVYSDDANWLCKPGIEEDVCDRDLDATIVYADGTAELEEFSRAVDPTIDCFYIYPTVSSDQGANSDLVPAEAEEISTVLNQAARLGSVCNVFAPVYRQRTLAALIGQVESDDGTYAVAYDDVVDAFKHFLANDSDGRPFVLVGHSQGAGMISELITNEIDNEPVLLDRLVSALILGTGIDKAGFDNVPSCASRTDTGCVVSYASFRNTVPPPDDSFFGRRDGAPALCVNPVNPAGGAAATSPYFPIVGALVGGGAQPFDDPTRTDEISTPFVKYPDMVTAECVDDGTFGYLELTISTADGPRIDDIRGDLTPQWGMHLIDANVAMGDLVSLVASQMESFQ